MSSDDESRNSREEIDPRAEELGQRAAEYLPQRRPLSEVVREREAPWGPINPRELFGTLAIRSADLQEMWVPQGQALQEWHEQRETADVLFKLNTGAGKTLIGLLAAQSLVNETHGRVLYVCATNQLLEQTKAKAAEYGIDVATYCRGEWEGDAYDRATGPGLTNYHAVFNGLSRFEREDLEAVVFDDAHTAHSIVRDQFTLPVLREDFPEAYWRLAGLVGAHFRETRRARLFEEVTRGEDPFSVLFVPLFVSAPRGPEMEDVLREEGVTDSQAGRFPWGHLRGRLSDCAMLLCARSIEFTPLVPPVHDLRPFRDGVRRLYLSATLEASAEFCRTFGRRPELVIAPGGRAGETERMILLAPRRLPEHEAVAWARALIEPHKALIMVPSYRTAEAWEDTAEIFRDGRDSRIREFAEAERDKLVLVGRYDGIDLPGDDCRVLVIDGLPVGRSLLESFYTDHLELEGISRGTIASRIVQLLGRISRGMSDHGVFLLVGERLRRWLADPRKRALLPEHIRTQLELGNDLARAYDEYPPAELIDRCLARDEEWLEMHRQATRREQAARERDAEDAEVEVALGEVDYVRRLWGEDYQGAARALARVRETTFELGPKLGAWHLHWTAHALQQTDRNLEAFDYYRQAAKACPELGRPPVEEAEVEVREGDPESEQARLMAELVLHRRGTLLDELERAAAILTDEATSSRQHEEAVRQIGAALGFRASRPDNEQETGPDVLWLTPDERLALVFELKTEKDETPYRKEEVGQLHQHIQWVRDTYPDAEQVPFLVGPRRGCTEQASPPPQVRVVSAEELSRLADDVRKLYRRVVTQGGDLLAPATLHAGLDEFRLSWASLPDQLETVELSALAVR